jgi:hypothetical protein
MASESLANSWPESTIVRPLPKYLEKRRVIETKGLAARDHMSPSDELSSLEELIGDFVHGVGTSILYAIIGNHVTWNGDARSEGHRPTTFCA